MDTGIQIQIISVICTSCQSKNNDGKTATFPFPASSTLPNVTSNPQSRDFPIPHISRESSRKQLMGASPAGSKLVPANTRVYDLIVQCPFSLERNKPGFEL